MPARRSKSAIRRRPPTQRRDDGGDEHARGVGGTATGAGARNPLKDPSSPLSKRIVYFDFDSYVVKDEYKPMIEAHGRYLQSNRNARMTIQGNTDERGSREYNIALGQRRADALKKLLVLYGATEIQIETVSFGKEKPRRDGHDEARGPRTGATKSSSSANRRCSAALTRTSRRIEARFGRGGDLLAIACRDGAGARGAVR